MGNNRKLKSWVLLYSLVTLSGTALFVLSSCFSSSVKDANTEATRKPSNIFDFLNPGSGSSGSSAATFETAFEQKNLNDQQKRGREIWFKATGNNDRFHAYVMAQKVGDHAMDFGRILQSVPKEKNKRFDNWGVMNDPECCHPGDDGCPARSTQETYGFDWCPGDDELLKHVGNNSEYRDPACDLDQNNGLQSACDLKFGTSTGVIGLRKFPNPRFDAAKWIKLTGSLDSWKNYMDHNKSDDQNHLADGSVEPPFRVGVSCASCHASFDPVHPPKDANHPGWDNISGTIGNQYMYTAQIFGSGFAQHSIQWQMLTNARPGTVDTSAVPNDQVNNPGTMNAIINFDKRPQYTELVDTWRPAPAGCPANSDPNVCTCNVTNTRCYERSTKPEPILHILKGGEDSVGPKNAILRVHFNIGVCAEQCWMNHLTDLEVLDPSQRNYGQTPFDIGQCRRDCPAYRALEDRVDDELAFLLTGRPFELYKAKGFNSPNELESEINTRFGTKIAKAAGATTPDQIKEEIEKLFGPRGDVVGKGREIFTTNCASCHSSPNLNVSTEDYLAKGDDGVRANWMGSDKRLEVPQVGTYECRSLHSNHMEKHVWSIYASEDYKKQQEVKNLSGEATGGRGHYRAISLLSAWATAPFMHNNAVGPEVCANHPDSKDLYLQVSGSQTCLPFNDPSAQPNEKLFEVEGRLNLFEASMDALLNPETRGKKQTLTTDEIDIPITPRVPGKTPLTVVIPKGIRVSRVGSFRHKEFVSDFRDYILGKANKTFNAEMVRIFVSLKASYLTQKDGRVVLSDDILQRLGTAYSNCTDTYEDKGHTFGSKLQPIEKEALKAFVETL
jgi:hypothetical protein